MPDDVDITAPVLPPVKTEEPGQTAPGLEPVAVTKDELEPVAGRRAAPTLSLEDDPQEGVSTRRITVEPPVEPTPAPAPPAPERLDEVAAPVPPRLARPATTPYGSDGFEGPVVPPPTGEDRAAPPASGWSTAGAQRLAWAIIALALAGLVAITALIASLR